LHVTTASSAFVPPARKPFTPWVSNPDRAKTRAVFIGETANAFLSPLLGQKPRARLSERALYSKFTLRVAMSARKVD
jgi:hypothetical protein